MVTFNGANDDPIAVPDSNGTAKNSTLIVSAAKGVLANDIDPDVHDNGHLGVSAVNGSGANVGHSVAGTYGSLTLNDDGSYVYVANQGSLPAKIVAQDTFQYTISDPHGGTDTANLYVVVFNPGTNYIAGINTTLNGGNGPDVVDGFAGHDIVLGGNGPDVLIGGNGDTLTGGNGPDTFLFRAHFGANTITDFDTHNDNMQFDKSIFTSAADILANHTTDTRGGGDQRRARGYGDAHGRAPVAAVGRFVPAGLGSVAAAARKATSATNLRDEDRESGSRRRDLAARAPWRLARAPGGCAAPPSVHRWAGRGPGHPRPGRTSCVRG